MVASGLRGRLPLAPPERSRDLDPRIAAAFAKSRKIRNAGLGALSVIYAGLLLLGFGGQILTPGTMSGPTPGWFIAVAAGCVAASIAVSVVLVRTWRCPNCRRFISNEFYWPGTRIELCRRCGVRLR